MGRHWLIFQYSMRRHEFIFQYEKARVHLSVWEGTG
jgi:hypothetical protein